MTRPVFADPKTDFVFKRIFGSETHKDLLIELLNDLLELRGAHRLADVTFLHPEQRVPIEGMKLSIVDVKCTDAEGTTYVVEMQVLNVEGFERRVVYNVSKSYTTQLRTGEGYPQLSDVVGVTICDFELWPEPVPMLSRWRMQEQHTGSLLGLGQIQYVFLELPKLDRSRDPRTAVEKWAYFFSEAENLSIVPPVLASAPFESALDAARMSAFTDDEWEAYDRAKIAEQDARGMLSLAERTGLAKGQKLGFDEGQKLGLDEGKKLGLDEGKKLGLDEGKKLAIRALAEVLGIDLDGVKEKQLAESSSELLQAILASLRNDRRWPEHPPRNPS
ncbi:MAG: Rpn family recombination-promoting nuclease/putative transposase [Deltaproteobacteria bacterium]|nr:Rpn family recombination-promoting nuclease/putative transposase [Deltaproteobacteria bacterium]